MTKDQLAKELKEKVKEGVKPSDIKKLKRSKSADDIPPAPSQSTPLNRSKSTEPFNNPKYPYTTLISQQEELERLQKETIAKSDTIKLLRKKIDELEVQIKERGTQNDALLAQLAEVYEELNEIKKENNQTPLSFQELDQALFKRHSNLKDWFTQYQKNKELDKELTENINEASTELINQDQTISNLRLENKQLKLTNHSLQKDLNLAHRAVEWRKSPLPDNSNSYPFLKYAFYSLAVALFFWILNKN